MDLKVKANLDYFMKSLSSIFPKYIRKSSNPNITLTGDSNMSKSIFFTKL